MERIKRYLRSAAGYQAVCAKWLVLAALVGCVVGPLGGAFGLALNWANATPVSYTHLTLPTICSV